MINDHSYITQKPLFSSKLLKTSICRRAAIKFSLATILVSFLLGCNWFEDEEDSVSDQDIQHVINSFTGSAGHLGNVYYTRVARYDAYQLVPLLIATLRDQNANTDVRKWCAYILGKVARDDQVDEVIGVLLSVIDGDGYAWWHRFEASFGLTQIFVKRSYQFSVSYFSHDHPEVRESIVTALGLYKGETQAQGLFADILYDTYEDDWVRSRAADYSHWLYDENEYLYEALLYVADIDNENISHVREGSVNSLGFIGDARAIPVVLKALSIATEPDYFVRWHAVIALEYINVGDQEVVTALMEAADYRIEEKSFVRNRAVSALGYFANPMATDLLSFISKNDPDEYVRRSALEALSAIENASLEVKVTALRLTRIGREADYLLQKTILEEQISVINSQLGFTGQDNERVLKLEKQKRALEELSVSNEL